jgi:predicted enzyme related to lactoylglutathione lyase
VTEIDILFSSVPVADFDAAVQWYGQLFGRDCDVVVHDSEVMWRLADSAWLYVIEDAERAGHTLVTFCVSHLDRALSELAFRGIECGDVEAVGVAGRKATVQDADGNSISFIEVNR